MTAEKKPVKATSPAVDKARAGAEATTGRVKKPSSKGALPKDARGLALSVLLKVEAGEDAQAALNHALKAFAARGGDARHAALCTELVYGSLRQEVRLNFVLHQFAAKPHKLPAEIRRILLLALYELLFLPHQAQHAVVHWAVEQSRGAFGKALSGVVNGILRSVQRRLDAVLDRAFYDKAGSQLEAEAVFHATPFWLAELWSRAYGLDACLQLMRRSQCQPWSCVRVNMRHAQGEPLLQSLLAHGGEAVSACGVAFAPGAAPAKVLDQSLAQWHDAGVLSWQAAGSLAVLDVVQKHCGEILQNKPVWDACAGQGGKALALLEQGIAVALCSDLSGARLRQLSATAQRLGLDCPSVLRMSAAQPCLRQWAGNILLDVPCSGLGTLARRPEIRWRRKPEDLAGLLALQQEILLKAWALLGSGAVLIYMTCTVNPAENEEQILALSKSHADCAVLAEWQTPHDHAWLEGMYVAVLQKQ